MTYVMDPDVTAMTAFVQRTRLPGEVLSSTNAQCLEGTLTFATLMEAIGIKPIVVLVPGHAFIGWHTVDKDGTKGEPLFVETTMVGNYDFETALKVANNRVASEPQVRQLQDRRVELRRHRAGPRAGLHRAADVNPGIARVS